MPTTSRSRARKPASKIEPAQPLALQAPSQGDSQAQSDTLLRLYASLLGCRRVQEWVHNTSGPAVSIYELRLGHEAVTVGATAELGSEDTISAPARDLAALVARRAPLKALVAGDGDMPLTAPWATAVLPEDPFHAGVGIALAHKLEGKGRVVVAFCAERQPSLNAWHEALEFATAQKLPILFVIEGESTAQEQGSEAATHLDPVSFYVRDHNFPGIVVDGSDVVAVWRVAQESVHRARNGLGPTLIDCRTDVARDPLTHMEHYLRKRSLWDEAWKHRLDSEIATAIAGTELLRA